MNQTEREETTRAVEQFLNESLERILLSNPVNPQQLSRARLRPLLIKGNCVSRWRSRRENRRFTAIWTPKRRQLM